MPKDRSVEILKRIYQQKVNYFIDMAKLYQAKLDDLEGRTSGNRLEKSQAGELEGRSDQPHQDVARSPSMVRKT